MKTAKEENYELVPFNEITDEARRIAVLWVENLEGSGGIKIEQKHKLASDIMNYAKHHASQSNWISVEEGLPDINIPIWDNLKSVNVLAVTDDYEIVIAYIEAVRPDFETKIWAVTESEREIKVIKWQYLPPANPGKKRKNITI